MNRDASQAAPASIRKRFVFSVGANIARAALSLIVGLLVARGLGPHDFGNLAYLLGSFWAIRALLDMGASSAFYTFISRRHRSRGYYTAYFGWLAVQFLVAVALVTVLLPQAVVDRFWLGQARELILLAFLATFLQNQAWQTVVQLHESQRRTIRIQLAGLVIVGTHLMLVAIMFSENWLSVRAVLWAIVAEYMAVVGWLAVTLRRSDRAHSVSAEKEIEGESLSTVLREYAKYCRPMIVIAIFSFGYEMADRWLLQRYGGAIQQGFFQVAAQLSTVSLLATTSVLNILWKETAEAWERGDRSRVIAIYQKTARLLVFLAALVSCFLAPWTEQLVDILLGPAYHDAWPVLLLMLFYPIYQALGQINGTLFMATGLNSVYMKLTVAGLVTSLPLSYFLIAPTAGATLPGLGLGAVGLAIKFAGLNLVFVNIQSWVIARHFQAQFLWRHQMVVILALLGLGSICQIFGREVIPLVSNAVDIPLKFAVFTGMAASGVIYVLGALVLIVRVPILAGVDHAEVARAWTGLKNLMQRS